MMHAERRWVIALIIGALIALGTTPLVAYAQGPTPPPAPPSQGAESGGEVEKILAIIRLTLDTLQGKTTIGADALFEQSQQAIANLVHTPNADLFFLDFGNPNLPLNQFAATVARNLLALTPLYAMGYVILLIFNVWRERPIPNPILYAVLVVGVMFFLAAFATITQSLSELGRALAVTMGGAGSAMFARGAFLDTIIRILVTLQKNGGIVSALALLIAIGEGIIILVQLAYRGLTMAVWRLIGVLLIPLSVLVEGTNPKTAGKVISGFFEAWLDMVGKITLLLIVLSIASAESLANHLWLVLPAGLLIVVSSWTFLKPLFTMIRNAVARAWANVAPADEIESAAPLPASAEAPRAREIDEERHRLVEE